MSSRNKERNPAVPESKRNVMVDAIRGVCLVVMAVDHLPQNVVPRFPYSPLNFFGFFNAAYGFIFLSGLVSGLVYGKIAEEKGDRVLRQRVLQRVKVLYFTQLFLFLTLLGSVMLGKANNASWTIEFPFFISDPLRAFFLGTFLLNEPVYLDILPMYCLFLLLVPLLLGQMRAGHIMLLLSVSFSVAVVTAKTLDIAPSASLGIDIGPFNPSVWQFLFVAGLVFGHGHRLQSRWFMRPVPLAVAGGALLSVLFVGARWHSMMTGRLDFIAEHMWFVPLSFINFAAFAYVLWAILLRFPQWAESRAARGLGFLGQHSLFVFAWSVAVAYAVRMTFSFKMPSIEAQATYVASTVLSLFASAWVHKQYQSWSQFRRAAHAPLSLSNISQWRKAEFVGATTAAKM